MQVGFVALETGSGRAKNVRNILLKNLVDVMLCALCWWAVGYAFAYGRSAAGVIGVTGFFFEGGDPGTPEILGGPSAAGQAAQAAGRAARAVEAAAAAMGAGNGTAAAAGAAGAAGGGGGGATVASAAAAAARESNALRGGAPPPRPWFFSWTFAVACVTVASGCLAERTRLAAYPAYTVALSSLVHPLLVHWVWGESSWLNASVSRCPVLDFAGGTVVHMAGGLFGLVGAALCGPRLGRFEGGAVKVRFV
jgi:ammonia channel protein AmtB